MPHSILHTVNQSPFDKNTLEQCQMVYKSGDSILLLEDGVYGALVSQPFAAALNDKTCYAIAADVEARGLNQQALLSHIKFIDYNRFVKLCTECDLVQSWY